jgi:hypothetical protein
MFSDESTNFSSAWLCGVKGVVAFCQFFCKEFCLRGFSAAI